MAIAEGRHGRWATVELTGERVSIAMVPELGGKVVSLVDRSAGRDWILPGTPPAALPAIDAAFGVDDAYGWDDCLPTIAPVPNPLDPDGPALRDHGDVWGRPVSMSAHSEGGSIETATAGVTLPFRFHRRLRVEGHTVMVDLAIENRGGRSFPVLWAAHPLLALEPGTRLHVPGVAAVRQWTGQPAGSSDPPELSWPAANLPGRGTVPLDLVQGGDAALALKLFAAVPGGRAAAEAPDGSWLGFAWDSGFAPYLGLWLDYGGWPAGSGMHQVALEPTTARADEISAAIEEGGTPWVPSGGRLDWRMEVVLGQGADELRDFLDGHGPVHRVEPQTVVPG
jgi:hypothetical protein